MRTFRISSGSCLLLLGLASAGCNLVLGLGDFKDEDGGQGGSGAGDTGGDGPTGANNTGASGAGGQCSEDPCKLVAPQCGCGEGEACTLDASGVNRVCAPAGSAMPNASCDGANQCVAGSFCNNGFCNPFCVDDGPCTPLGSVCALPFGSGDLICSDPCDPTTGGGCVAGSGCYLGSTEQNVGFAVCFPSANVPDGGACGSLNDCSPGSGCYDDGAGNALCFRQCFVANGEPCPSLGLTCVAFDPPVVVVGNEFGVCL